MGVDENEIAKNKICERCQEQHKEVCADGYVVGFLCLGCYKFVYGIE